MKLTEAYAGNLFKFRTAGPTFCINGAVYTAVVYVDFDPRAIGLLWVSTQEEVRLIVSWREVGQARENFL